MGGSAAEDLAGVGASGSEDDGADSADDWIGTEKSGRNMRSENANLRGAIRFPADRQLWFVPFALSAKSRFLGRWGSVASRSASWKRNPDTQRCLPSITLEGEHDLLWILREWKSYPSVDSDAVLSRKVTWNRRKH